MIMAYFQKKLIKITRFFEDEVSICWVLQRGDFVLITISYNCVYFVLLTR